MITYPTEVKQMSPAVNTGRIVFIDDATKFTPNKLFNYLSEGFVPVARTVGATATYEFVEHSVAYGPDAEYTLTVGKTTYTSADWDAPFEVSA